MRFLEDIEFFVKTLWEICERKAVMRYSCMAPPPPKVCCYSNELGRDMTLKSYYSSTTNMSTCFPSTKFVNSLGESTAHLEFSQLFARMIARDALKL